MKKNIVIFLILAGCIIAVGGLVRLLFGSSGSVDFQIFKSYVRGYELHKLLGIIPEEFEQAFEKRVVERYNGIEILYVVDKKLSSHPYFVIEKQGQQIEFIKAYSYMLGNPSVEGGSQISMAINLPIFNHYVRHHQLEKKKVYQKYCLFLSRQESPASFKVLEDASDIDSLLSSRQNMRSYLDKFPETYNIIEPDEINPTASIDNVIHCWFVNHGMVRFRFSFEEESNQLKRVDSEVIGFLGIEVPM